MYAVQSIAIALALYCEKGFNKEFFICILYASVPLCLSSIGVGIMKYYHIETTLAISLFGPGVAFVELVKDYLLND